MKRCKKWYQKKKFSSDVITSSWEINGECNKFAIYFNIRSLKYDFVMWFSRFKKTKIYFHLGQFQANIKSIILLARFSYQISFLTNDH